MGPPLNLLPVSPMTGSPYSKIRKYRRKSRRLRLGERLTKIMAGARIGRPPVISIRRLDSKLAIANPIHESFFLAAVDLDHRAVDIVR
jgi:hypothetical protein